MASVAAQVSNGRSAHLGAAVTPVGGNFCVHSKFATRVERLLFDRKDAAVPGLVVELDPYGLAVGTPSGDGRRSAPATMPV